MVCGWNAVIGAGEKFGRNKGEEPDLMVIAES
jgi:hypothetical protein